MLATLLATWVALAPATTPLATLGPDQRKPQHEKADRAGIDALFKALDAALTKGNAEAYAGVMDFPVTIVTDDASGAPTSVTLDHDAFVQAVSPYLAASPHLKVVSKRSVTVLSDALATVLDVTTLTLGKTKGTSQSGAVVVQRAGAWRIKVLTEPGWGPLLAPHPAATP
jgi:hypothetical protein